MDYKSRPGADRRLTSAATSFYVQNESCLPTGNTEFQFHAAGMNFKSTSYEWLVVAGHKAQYKGEGTINGNGSHKFLLTATDGQAQGGGGIDKFRIKITEQGGGLVYDNSLGNSDDIDSADPQAISGGSIVVHK